MSRLTLMVGLALIGCGDGEPQDSGKNDACSQHAVAVTWEGGGEAFFRTRCCSCHSSTAPYRYGAPEYLNYDTFEGVQEAVHAIQQAALWDQVMPPGLPLSAEEQELLESFLDCGL